MTGVPPEQYWPYTLQQVRRRTERVPLRARRQLRGAEVLPTRPGRQRARRHTRQRQDQPRGRSAVDVRLHRVQLDSAAGRRQGEIPFPGPGERWRAARGARRRLRRREEDRLVQGTADPQLVEHGWGRRRLRLAALRVRSARPGQRLLGHGARQVRQQPRCSTSLRPPPSAPPRSMPSSAAMRSTSARSVATSAASRAAAFERHDLAGSHEVAAGLPAVSATASTGPLSRWAQRASRAPGARGSRTTSGGSRCASSSRKPFDRRDVGEAVQPLGVGAQLRPPSAARAGRARSAARSTGRGWRARADVVLVSG